MHWPASRIIGICSCWVRTQAGRAPPANQDKEMLRVSFQRGRQQQRQPQPSLHHLLGSHFTGKKTDAALVHWHLGWTSPSKTSLCFCSRPVTPIAVCSSQYGKPVAGTRQAGWALSRGLADFSFKTSNHAWAT